MACVQPSLLTMRIPKEPFFSECVKFTIFTGFYWWLLINGPSFAMDIVNSIKERDPRDSKSPATKIITIEIAEVE